MNATVDQKEFDRQQAEFFNAWAQRFANAADDAAVGQRLSRVCDLAMVVASDMVVDVGTGCGVMIPHLLKRGVPAQRILGVDLSDQMLAVARARYAGAHFTGGNFVNLSVSDEICLRESGATLVLFNACFGNMPDPVQAIRAAVRLIRDKGRIVISHPMGSRLVEFLHAREPHIVPNLLPAEASLRSLLGDMPLELVEFIDEPDFYFANLAVRF